MIQLAILWWVLTTLNAPTWCWVCWWVCVGTCAVELCRRMINLGKKWAKDG